MPRRKGLLSLALRSSLILGRVVEGLSLASEAVAVLNSSTPPELNQIELIAELAIWIDFDFSLREPTASAAGRWPKSIRKTLLHRHWLLLRFADSVVQMHNQEFGGAVEGLIEVINGGDALDDPYLHLVVTFFAARCRYYQNRYSEAEEFAKKAIDHGSSELQDATFPIAIVNILRSRILLKRQPSKDAAGPAREMLENAWEVFKSTDQHVTKGNILIFLALIAKRGLRPHKSALDLLGEAITEFNLDSAGRFHPGHARALMHRARLLRQKAQAMKEEAGRERSAVPVEHNEKLLGAIRQLKPWLLSALAQAPSHVRGDLRKSLAEIQAAVDKSEFNAKSHNAHVAIIRDLQERALSDLIAAQAIYRKLGHWRGIADSHTFMGYVRLDRGEYDAALADAKEAYSLGLGKDSGDKSPTVQARAALLATATAWAMFEDQIGTDFHEHSVSARQWADKALKQAELTKEPRIVGRAHVWQALTREDYDQEAIRLHRATARDILRQCPGGSLQHDWQILEKRLNSEGGPAALLSDWVRTKTGVSFDELEIAISQLTWEVTGNVQDFMERLAVKPKKVVGLLNRAGIRKMSNSQNGKGRVAKPQSTQ